VQRRDLLVLTEPLGDVLVTRRRILLDLPRAALLDPGSTHDGIADSGTSLHEP
jgi:hypothetical protein